MNKLNSRSTRFSKYAVLIDGDNAQASLLTQILAEVSKFGLITIKRIYGDWPTPVQVYSGEERHRQRHDNRCHGLAA